MFESRQAREERPEKFKALSQSSLARILFCAEELLPSDNEVVLDIAEAARAEWTRRGVPDGLLPEAV